MFVASLCTFILRRRGQSQLTRPEKQLEVRKRSNKKIAAAFVSALTAKLLVCLYNFHD